MPEASLRRRSGYPKIDVLHACTGGPAGAGRNKRLHLLRFAGNQRFYSAIGAITHPAIETEAACFAGHESAIADALDHAFDPQP